MKKYIAEFLGTFTLVLFGCGVAVFSGSLATTAFAFGLALTAAAYAIGSISGCHINPAVSLAMLILKKLDVKDFIGYVIAQIAGAFAGSGVLMLIIHFADDKGHFEGKLGQNLFGIGNGIGLNMWGALTAEIVLTFIFVLVIIGVTSDKGTSSLAGLAIGGALVVIHLIGIKLTGTSVNPARSLAPAVLAGGQALEQVWVFIVAPLIGAAIAALVWKFCLSSKKD